MAFDPTTAKLTRDFKPVKMSKPVEMSKPERPVPKTMASLGAPSYLGGMEVERDRPEESFLTTALRTLGEYGKAAIQKPGKTLAGAAEAVPVRPVPFAPQYGQTLETVGLPKDYFLKAEEERQKSAESLPDTERKAYDTGGFLSRTGQGAILGSLAAPFLGTGFSAQVVREAVEELPFILQTIQEGAQEGGWEEALKKGSSEVALSTLINLGTKGLGQIPKKIKAGKEAAEQVRKKVPVLGEVPYEDIRKGKYDFVKDPETGNIIDMRDVKVPLFTGLSQPDAKALFSPKAKETIPFNQYATQAEIVAKSATTGGIITPLQLAATNATKAFKAIDNIRKDVGKRIGNKAKEYAEKTINIADIKQKYMELINDRIGGITEGDLPRYPGLVEAANDAKKTFESLGDEISVIDGVKLKDNLRDGISASFVARGKMKPQTGVLDGIIKEVSSDVDDLLDDALPGYDKLNKKYRQIKTLEDRFNRTLGETVSDASDLTKHGASIMKRAVTSGADSNVSEIFRQARALTGGDFDLMQDAIYAKIAMNAVGDPRQLMKAENLMERLPRTGRGVVDRAIGEGIGAITKPITDKKLKRILDAYEKAQKAYSQPFAEGAAEEAARQYGLKLHNPQLGTTGEKLWDEFSYEPLQANLSATNLIDLLNKLASIKKQDYLFE